MCNSRLTNIAKAHNDDISNVLILNKKSISNQESQLFHAELEKFRPHQNRLLQGTHKQSALMKELTKTFGDLLQDKRVRSEQARYESFTRQRNQVLTKYKKIFQAFNSLIDGLMHAQSFYSEMRDTVESLEKNVETFVNNRRSEGAQLLGQLEREKASNAGGQADKERDRLRELMERMSMDPSSSPTQSVGPRPALLSRPAQGQDSYRKQSPAPAPSMNFNPKPSSTTGIGPSGNSSQTLGSYQGYSQFTLAANGAAPEHTRDSLLSGRTSAVGGDLYNPMAYPYQTLVSTPPASHVAYYSNNGQPIHSQYPPHGHYLPQGYVPPPPPPGPPPNPQMNFDPGLAYPSGPGGYAQYQPPRQSNSGGAQQEQQDPWAGLNAWK